MSAYEVLSVLVMLVFGVLCTRMSPRVWRNEFGWNPDRPASFWPWGRTLWRGFIRVIPLGGPLMLAIAPGYGLDNAGVDGAAATTIVAASVTLGLLILSLCVGAFLFNRPKWAVAPHLRHQQGAVGEWRGRTSEPTPPPAEQPPIRLSGD